MNIENALPRTEYELVTRAVTSISHTNTEEPIQLDGQNTTIEVKTTNVWFGKTVQSKGNYTIEAFKARTAI